MGLTSVSRDDVQHPKPHPEPYLLAALRMKVAPGDVLVVEDSPVGAAAGLSAGMRVLAWPAPGLLAESFPTGCVLVNSLHQLRAALDLTIGEDA
jgi:beta-phosphoglucomutase-like phosphatase (HAD superfamily)